MESKDVNMTDEDQAKKEDMAKGMAFTHGTVQNYIMLLLPGHVFAEGISVTHGQDFSTNSGKFRLTFEIVPKDWMISGDLIKSSVVIKCMNDMARYACTVYAMLVDEIDALNGTKLVMDPNNSTFVAYWPGHDTKNMQRMGFIIRDIPQNPVPHP